MRAKAPEPPFPGEREERPAWTVAEVLAVAAIAAAIGIIPLIMLPWYPFP